MAMVAALKFEDLFSARVAAGQTDGAHPTDRKTLTGLLTPPDRNLSAISNSYSDLDFFIFPCHFPKFRPGNRPCCSFCTLFHW
jgi:hypothetical protein